MCRCQVLWTGRCFSSTDGNADKTSYSSNFVIIANIRPGGSLVYARLRDGSVDRSSCSSHSTEIGSDFGVVHIGNDEVARQSSLRKTNVCAPFFGMRYADTRRLTYASYPIASYVRSSISTTGFEWLGRGRGITSWQTTSKQTMSTRELLQPSFTYNTRRRCNVGRVKLEAREIKWQNFSIICGDGLNLGSAFNSRAILYVLFVLSQNPSEAWSDATQRQNPEWMPRLVLRIWSPSADSSSTSLVRFSMNRRR